MNKPILYIISLFVEGVSRMKTLRVRVDSELCQGHSRCCAIAPELFESDELGNAHAIGDGRVPAGLEAKARLAVANCPEHAVRLTSE